MRLLKGYEVEWCVDVPTDKESDDADLDNADLRIKDFAKLDDARKFAKAKLPDDWFGQVSITPFEMVPFEPGYPGLTREYTGEPEYITE